MSERVSWPSEFVTAIVAAGGRGTRMGGGRPKQFLAVHGRSILDRTLDALAAADRIDAIVVALPADEIDGTALLAERAGKPLTTVAGGARRQDSVANAFAAIDPRTTLVAVHDAARPFVTADLLARVIEAAAAHGAAIAALPVRDTVKQARGTGAGIARTIAHTLPRDGIVLAQTPQAFRREIFAQMLAAGSDREVTDEAMLAEHAGVPVHLVEGDPANVKLTTMSDLEEARARLATDDPVPFRIGTGYDLHRLVEGRPLILAGVRIPFERGLDGHSDADIVCHAVTDAVLGAAALGDIGRMFPDTDPAWKGADSVALLRGAVAVVREAGWRVHNVDATVIAQRPKLLPHLDAMRATVAAALECGVDDVSIKGKTNERVDAIGREDAMACHAVAMLTRTPRSTAPRSGGTR